MATSQKRDLGFSIENSVEVSAQYWVSIESKTSVKNQKLNRECSGELHCGAA